MADNQKKWKALSDEIRKWYQPSAAFTILPEIRSVEKITRLLSST